VPAIARLVLATAGPSVVALRLLPALAGGAAVVLTALTARELGGGRTAQLVAALAAATSAQLLAMFHLLSTSPFDVVFWNVVVLLVVRMLRTGNDRLWLAIGGAGGVGLMNKLNVGLLLAAVVVALAAGRRRRLVRSRFLPVGAALAAAIVSPDLIWNATHQWAQVSMMRSLRSENASLANSLTFIPAQLVVVGPALALLWIGGLGRLLRHDDGRPLALAYLGLLVFFAATGGKAETMFARVVPAGVVTTPHNAWTEERGAPIFVCTDQTETWAQAWPSARHYG